MGQPQPQPSELDGTVSAVPPVTKLPDGTVVTYGSRPSVEAQKRAANFREPRHSKLPDGTLITSF